MKDYTLHHLGKRLLGGVMNTLHRIGKAIVGVIALAISFNCFASATGTLTNGGNLNFGVAASGDPSPDGTADIDGYLAGVVAIHLLSPSGWAYSSSNYANSNLTEARAATYNTDYQAGHGFIPDDYSSFGSVYYMRTGSGGSVKYFKMHTNGTNTSSGLPLLWDYLGTGGPSPPVSDFTFSSYDLITNFTDTSTGGTPTAWSWNFGDSNTSSSQNPQHRYASANTYNACLTASNSGGGDGQKCKNVTVALVPSTLVAVNGTFDLDGDTTADMQVKGPGCPPIVNQLHMLGTAKYAFLYKDYRNVTAADIGGGPTSTGDFCVDIDYLQPFLVKASSGAIYKAWTAGNDSSGIRLQYDLLQAAPPPVPVSSFTSSKYDLIVQFTDTSTNTPNLWAWTFGDAQTSSQQSPKHRYATAASYNACLTASNSGGAGNNACTSITVSLRPSTTVLTGSSLDLDSDGTNDLLVSGPSGCSVPNKLTPINGAEYAFASGNYQNLTANDALAAHFSSSSGGFCVAVDYSEPFFVLSSNGSIYRAWTAANDVGSVRIEFSLLVSGERIFANGFE